MIEQELKNSDDCRKSGKLFLDAGNLEAAAECYQALIGLLPEDSEAYFKLGNIYVKQGSSRDAEACYRKAIDLDPAYVKARYNLANLYRRSKRLAEAEAAYREVLDIQPDYYDAAINLSACLLDQVRFADAEKCCRDLLRDLPNEPEVINNLGAALSGLSRHNDAINAYKASLKLDPSQPVTNNNLGGALAKEGHLEEAERYIRLALDLNPGFIDANNNLGIVLKAQGRFSDAEAAHCRALELQPENVDTLCYLGALLVDVGRLDDAELAYRTALAADPDSAQVHLSLGGVLANKGLAQEATFQFRKVLEIDPDSTAAHSNLLFSLNYSTLQTSGQRLQEASRFGETATRLARQPFDRWACEPQPERLRVGIVSGDFRTHPVAFFLEGVLHEINRNRIDLFAYYSGPMEDDTTQRFKVLVDKWRPITHLDDQATARLIHDDKIAILVDLAGHTTNNRLPVFAWRPAPLQVSWLGYFATTGLMQIDYVLADETGVPRAQQMEFIEAIWYLPTTRLCYSAARNQFPISELPARDNGHITFGCFQNLAKMNGEVLETWAAILARTDKAHLRIQSPQLGNEAARSMFVDRLRGLGIESSRLVVTGPSRYDEYINAHGAVDIILDTFPYTGGTTTCEALLMGVPTLTLLGSSLLGRQGASLISAAGLGEWIAGDKSEYISKALAFSQPDYQPQLAELRRTLRNRASATALFDARRFARNLEDALFCMWDEKLRSRARNDEAFSDR